MYQRKINQLENSQYDGARQNEKLEAWEKKTLLYIKVFSSSELPPKKKTAIQVSGFYRLELCIPRVKLPHISWPLIVLTVRGTLCWSLISVSFNIYKISTKINSLDVLLTNTQEFETFDFYPQWSSIGLYMSTFQRGVPLDFSTSNIPITFPLSF